MTYHNGPLIANVQVETIYYGANWGTTPALQTEANQLDAFFTAITDSTWMDIFNQYSVTSPSPITIGHGNLLGRDANNPAIPATTTPVGVLNDDDNDGDGAGDNDSDPNLDQQHLANVTESDIQNMIVAEAGANNVPATTGNTLYFVFIQPGAISQFDTVNSFGGHHRSFTSGSDTYYYAVIPLSLATRPTGSVQQSFNSLTVVASHELAEAITDPVLNAGWDANNSAGQEIGDLCNGISDNYHGYLVQEEHSNIAFPSQNTAADSCIIEVDKPLDSLVVNSPSSPVEGNLNGTYTVATFHDQDTTYRMKGVATDFTATITWGDGSTTPGTIVDNGGGNFAVQGSHTYLEEGNYTLSVEIDDVGGSTVSGSTSVSVSDPAVVATGASSTFNAVERAASDTQTVATFTDPGGVYEGDSHYSATIDWGDGHTSPGSISSGTVSGSHMYTEEGSYTITVTVYHDSAPAATPVTTAASVSDPAVDAIGDFVVNAVEGADSGSQPVATFTDPGGDEPLDEYSATINWGDGHTSSGTITYDSGVFTVSGNHTYAEESGSEHPGSDPYQITVTISHGEAPDAVAHSTAVVSDPAVTPTGGFNFVAVEGDPSALQTVATFTDPGGAESLNDYLASIDWGDGHTSSGTISVDSGVFTVKGSHTYATGLGEPGEFGNTFCDADPPSYHKPITVTITHENAPTAQAVSDAKISLKPGTAHLTNLGSLIVVGTSADDTIVLNNVGGNARTVTVQLGSTVLGTFTISNAGRIVVAAMGGNDNVQVAGGIVVQTVLYGGPGNDRLKGGGGRNILVGCDGDDTLTAGNLGDVLIGGAGADRLIGGNGNDLLVSALLVDGSNNEDDGYNDLVTILNTGAISAPLHVMDDGAVDKLTGGGGTDTAYYNFTGGGVLDIATDKPEFAFDI
jgi:hypothetical protein